MDIADVRLGQRVRVKRVLRRRQEHAGFSTVKRWEPRDLNPFEGTEGVVVGARVKQNGRSVWGSGWDDPTRWEVDGTVSVVLVAFRLRELPAHALAEDLELIDEQE